MIAAVYNKYSTKQFKSEFTSNLLHGQTLTPDHRPDRISREFVIVISNNSIVTLRDQLSKYTRFTCN